MADLFFSEALLPDGWARNVRISIADGRVARIERDAAARPDDETHALGVPGLPNLHSHAFQRGMAGLAEIRGPASDSFWTWRDRMYRFVGAMTPEDVEVLAAQAYVEMLETGFTRVAEFHYVHHDRDGTPYANLAELGARIGAAARQTGIGLALLPVFYAHAGFGGRAPEPAQRRFVNDIDQYGRLVEACRAALRGDPGATVGIAPHSLRAATPDELAALLPLAQGQPIHIHIAEQTREVDDCLAWSGQRPVEWLLDHAPVDGGWCLVHATHMTLDETRRMAASGAVAGLCPITEANLGDGTFDAVRFVAAGGVYGVGSDSNVQIGAADELRQLEYSQRLALRARNVMAMGEGGSTGRALFDGALAGGAQATGLTAGIVEGGSADLVSLARDHVAFAGRTGDALLDAWIFAGGRGLVDCVWMRGGKVVEHGRHRDADAIARRFRRT
ncbi:formimidoylglutamate deiminase, partial [Aliidongia dinghuensis]|uniref:formimidoylglutamate deiminase n=1 Tax=Aliidongia dinghuensis TaxID=1867774 RepID=UPI00166569E2